MKVLVSDPIAEQGIEILKQAGIEVVQQPGLSPEELAKIIGDYDGIIVRSATKVTKEVIEAAKNLKVIGRAGIGLDNVDRETAKAKNIKVVNTPTATSISVAELALGMMFAAARRIPQASISTKAGKWEKKQFKGFELYGKTLGIIGIGRIGTELAKRAQALGMEIMAFDPNVTQHDHAQIVDLDTLVSSSDYISLHAPLTAENKHIFGLEQFKKMKPTAYIINTSRGGLIDEQALHQAITTGEIAGAGLDVTDPEPPRPDNPLLKLDQVLVTAHSASCSESSVLDLQQRSAEAILLALKGKLPPYLANPNVVQQENCRIGRDAADGSLR